MRSMAAVTTRQPEWRTAAMPATSSHMRMISPPWTLPALLAVWIPIQRVRTDADSDGGRGSTRLGSLGASSGTAFKSRRSASARARWTHVNRHQGEDLEDPRPRRGSPGDPRLQLPEAGRAASEGQEGHRGRGDREEAPADAVAEARAAGGQARHAGAPGALPGARGPRPHGARAQDARPDRAPVAQPAGRRARVPAGVADREGAEAALPDRPVPDQEGGHQGPVL